MEQWERESTELKTYVVKVKVNVIWERKENKSIRQEIKVRVKKMEWSE